MRAFAAPIAVCVVALNTLSGCSNAGDAPAAYAERFDEARVEVRLTFEPGAGSTGTIVALFTPTADGIHLYGVDLPPTGIDGAGRPTLVSVDDASWRATGALVASPASSLIEYPGFEDPFPVYPDGAVTLRQAVERTTATDDGSIDATVTFMACTSSGLCFVPVENRRLSIPTH